MPEPELTFKEMCARFDATPRTLRYYEYIELLAPRKDGRARYYGPREIARMTLILRGRRFGFSLEEIRKFLLIYDQKGTREQNLVWLDLADLLGVGTPAGVDHGAQLRVGFVSLARPVARSPQRLDLRDREAEEEEVLGSDRLADLQARGATERRVAGVRHPSTRGLRPGQAPRHGFRHHHRS